jgi:MYXO-CTERM domain-containing protein
VTGASVSGPFLLEESLPVEVAPGESLSLSVTFAPTAFGEASGSLSLTSNASGDPSTVTLSGRGLAPRMVVTPASLDLGSVNVGRTSTAQKVTVSNTGDTALVLTGVSLSGAAAGDFATTASPLELAPGASSSFLVTFSPTAVGARSARLTLLSTDPQAPGIEVALSGVGTSPVLELSAASLDFGGVRVGKSPGERTLTVKNTGTGPLTLTSASVSGTSATRFSVAISSLPYVIPAGGGTDLTVTFLPDSVGVASAELTLLSDDAAQANVVVPLTGTGRSPRLGLSATTLDFGAQGVGRTSSPRSFTVTNTGSDMLTLSGVTVEGSGAAAFAFVDPPTLPLVLAPGAGTTLRVTMATEEVGVSEAVVLLESDDDETPRARVVARGTGVSQVLSLSLAEVSFGTFRLPARSSPRTVVITNLTAEPIELAEPELLGTHVSHFQVSGRAGPLEAGASVTVTVVYETTTAADSRALLRIATRDGSTALAVALSGRAVSKLVGMAPSSLDFGVVEEGATSPAQTVTLTNLSTEPVVVSELQSDNEAFAVTASGLSSPLAPGASGTFTVTFSPKALGPVSGQVRVTLQGASEPEAVVAVSGTGRARDPKTGESGCGCGQGPGGSPWPASLMLALTLGWLWRARRRAS